MTEPINHPDLVELAQRMRQQLHAVLRAEQEAAAASRLRRRVVRDRLLEAEDRAEQITVFDVAGGTRSGTVTSVGADHVVLDETTFVLLAHAATIEFAS